MPSLRIWLAAVAAVALPGVQAGAGAASDSFDANGVKIHYLLEGKGEPVVLIHGLHASAETNWKLTGVIADLARDHQVIALDMPGHGQSDKPENDSAYGDQVVEDVVLLLDRLKIKKAHVVGYSLGGMVVVKFLTKHPERVASALVGGMGWFRRDSPLQKIWEKMPAKEDARTPPAFIRNVGQLAVTEAELRRIRLPVEVLVGERDPVKRLYVAPLQPVRGDWRVVEIADAGHFNCIFKKQFRDEIGSWVRKNSGATK